MSEKEPVITVMVTNDSIQINKAEGERVDAEILNNALLTLPAKTYLGLFREMYKGVYGYPPFMNYGGRCGSLEDNTEGNLV